MDNWRIGAVSYLNTRPLIHNLQVLAPEANLVLDLPSRLADQLARGDLDVALIPSIEVFQHPDYTVVSDACIACCGPVWSVKLMSRVPLPDVGTLALDEGSRTSIALIRLLMEKHVGTSPTFIPLDIDDDWTAVNSDAVLIIGDRAMHPGCADTFPIQMDLGQWWFDWTGLPFVFAMWTARPGMTAAEMSRLDRILSASRDAGLESAEPLAATCAIEYGLSNGQCREYFQKYLHFRLGPDERKGLEHFRQMAFDMNMAPTSRELQFHDC
ncbi:MAG: menaquinone biosynthetic enzyme MqnA/MqnD family protein [Pirellulaceae bacterium]